MAVAGSIKGEMVINKPVKGGWLITALRFFFFLCRGLCGL